MSAMDIRLVSINIWDLPIRLPRTQRGSRHRQLLQRLPTLDADIILIQEAFRPRLRRAILHALPQLHPDPFAREGRWMMFLRMDRSGGLFTLSRWPLTATRYQPARRFRHMRPDERIGSKGCLWTRIATPAGELLVGNVHLYAGTWTSSTASTGRPGTSSWRRPAFAKSRTVGARASRRSTPATTDLRGICRGTGLRAG
jgi:endonuclease/exonuclease/phosphatase family metal-dependent hydrolase